MNIQKIFEALREDEQNSALGIICSELEAQGYRVAIAGKYVDSKDIFSGRHADIEKKMEPQNLSLYRKDLLEQEFSVEFTEYHEIAIKPKIE
jgi:hypothetical protein